MKGNWAAAPTQQPVLIIICWSVAWAMINDSVRPKTKHSASYLQSTCSCGPIGREWKRVQAAHGLIMGGKKQERGRGKGRAEVEEEMGMGELALAAARWQFQSHDTRQQMHAHLKIAKKEKKDCAGFRASCATNSAFRARSKIIPNNSAGIYSLRLALTKCQLAGSFPARCEHAACGSPPWLIWQTEWTFTASVFVTSRAPLSPAVLVLTFMRHVGGAC